MTPYKMQNLVYEWVNFSKFPNVEPILAEILEKSGDFAQNLAPKWADWYMNGSLFLKNWYLHGSTFKFCGGTSLPKPNLGTSLSTSLPEKKKSCIGIYFSSVNNKEKSVKFTKIFVKISHLFHK